MWRDIAIGTLAPGVPSRTRRPRLSVVLVVAGVVAPLMLAAYVLFSGRNWVALTLDTGFLGVVVAVGVAAVAARVASVIEVWGAAGHPRPLAASDGIALAVSAGIIATGSFVVADVGRARSSLQPAFAGSGAEVLFDAEALPVATTPSTIESALVSAPPSVASSTTEPGVVSANTVTPVPLGDADIPEGVATTTTTTTLPPLPERPDSGIDRTLLTDITTVLLIGGDAGPGRWGLRTDSMMLFSLHRPSGRASLISVPRNLQRLLFPPESAMESRYPYGYPGIANAVYVEVQGDRSMREAYDVPGVRPGVVALAHGLGYSLDVTIDDYVLVDMQGFLDLIDALGGVTINVREAVPMPGNVPGALTQYPDEIGPGLIEMDGSTALGYARSRKGDNDYRRARRQRELLAALATQISLGDVVGSFADVADAIGGTLRTSLTPEELADTLNVIGGETAIVESVGLVPPLISVRRPDFDQLAAIVGAVQLALVTGERSGY